MVKSRNTRRQSMGLILLLAVALVGVGLALPAQANPPAVKVVPWVATNSLVPHDTYPAKSIHLKGATDTTATQYYWDYGDGSAVQAWTNVADRYVLEAVHTYSGTPGNVFTARLWVKNAGGETASMPYYIKLQPKALAVEVNVAIDEGLWELHKEQRRWDGSGISYGAWDSCRYGGGACDGNFAITPINVLAFEVNGHLESGDAGDPYTETVARGLNQTFAYLAATPIPSSRTFPVIGSYAPDGDANGYAVLVNQGNPFYEGGMFVDAVVASGTPDKLVTTGSLANSRTYKGIVQDMVDYYAYCAYNGGTAWGGWRYSCGDWPDNSPSQWGAIAIIPAVREWGVTVDPKVMTANLNWLKYSYYNSGSFAGFGYTDPNYYPWGPYATTPSGMVQLAMDGKGRGTTVGGVALWDNVETTMRNNFANGGGSGSSIKAYYYGMFSFVKSLLLNTPPITMLQSSTPGVNPIDWYGAEQVGTSSTINDTSGVARTIVNDQNTTWGYWYGHNADGRQFPYETAFAVIMLNRTLFTGGAPVAVGVATPNPAMQGETVTLDGRGSFHQDPTKTIVAWKWDVDMGGGNHVVLTGPTATISFSALGNYNVTLTVTDNAQTAATASSILTVIVSIPPLPPTANAGGPYDFCLGTTAKFFLDGSKTVNPDEGQHQPGAYPGDTIYGNPNQFSWNLGNAFGDAFGIKPDVTAFFTGKGAGQYLITLQVTDTTAASYPNSGKPNQSSTSTAQVFVRASSDPLCAGCIHNLAALAKNRIVGLSWTLTGADHYNVYRSVVNGGPYTKIGVATAIQSVYTDTTVTNGTTYYYVVRPATLGDIEICQSNQASGLPKLR